MVELLDIWGGFLALISVLSLWVAIVAPAEKLRKLHNAADSAAPADNWRMFDIVFFLLSLAFFAATSLLLHNDFVYFVAAILVIRDAYRTPWLKPDEKQEFEINTKLRLRGIIWPVLRLAYALLFLFASYTH